MSHDDKSDVPSDHAASSAAGEKFTEFAIPQVCYAMERCLDDAKCILKPFLGPDGRLPQSIVDAILDHEIPKRHSRLQSAWSHVTFSLYSMVKAVETMNSLKVEIEGSKNDQFIRFWDQKMTRSPETEQVHEPTSA